MKLFDVTQQPIAFLQTCMDNSVIFTEKQTGCLSFTIFTLSECSQYASFEPYFSGMTWTISELSQQASLESFHIVHVFYFQAVNFSLINTKMLQSDRFQCRWTEQ